MTLTVKPLLDKNKAKTDLIETWYERYTILNPTKTTTFSECYNSYQNFIENEKCICETKKSFSIVFRRIIKEKGLESKVCFQIDRALKVKGLVIIK